MKDLKAYSEEIKLATEAALKAGDEIMKVYQMVDREIERKSDNSPLTLADRLAHKKIMEYLKQTPYPVLSEEGRDIPYEERKHWEEFWLVDPLDGTKEFIKRNGEFTVNIALISKGKTIWGVVYAPVLDQLYSIDAEGSAYLLKNGKKSHLPVSLQAFDKNKPNMKVVASRSHANQGTQDYLAELNSPEIVTMGSSLKFMMVASGEADVYPRFAPTMEWDSAAAHAVVKATGRNVVKTDGEELSYNKENLLNPWFICC